MIFIVPLSNEIYEVKSVELSLVCQLTQIGTILWVKYPKYTGQSSHFILGSIGELYN